MCFDKLQMKQPASCTRLDFSKPVLYLPVCKQQTFLELHHPIPKLSSLTKHAPGMFPSRRLNVVVIDDELGSLGGACCGSTELFLGSARRLVPSATAPCHRLLWDAAAKHSADVRAASCGGADAPVSAAPAKNIAPCIGLIASCLEAPKMSGLAGGVLTVREA